MGIAVEPVFGALTSSAWLRVVRRRLSKQGISFIPHGKMRDYLETESAYWIDRWGGTHRWRQAQTPAFGERLLWRLKLPPLLVNRELALCEFARRGVV